jgi:hypothetical protein
LVEREIVLASLTGRGEATGYARQAVAAWLDRVRQHSEQEFIPWYTSYWTQEWLMLKLALHGHDGADQQSAASRELAKYLQAKFASQVLEPASEPTGPGGILRQATAIYLRALRTAVAQAGQRHRLPARALRAWLEQVPAIAPAASGLRGVSLGELLAAEPTLQVAAYDGLLQRIAGGGAAFDRRMTDAELLPAACAVADAFVERIAARGGSAAATVIGGPVGAVISLGLGGWSYAQHEQDRPQLEAKLREQLLGVRGRWYRELLQEPEAGVLGAVQHIHGQIVAALRGGPAEPPSPPYDSPW